VGHPHVVVERRAGYLWVALSRPERRNALNPGMVAALSEALEDASDEVVVLSSADPRVFCAGADLVIPAAERAAVSDLLYQCYEHIITRAGPVIAVLRGAAVGGGAQLASAADLRIVSPDARLRWSGPPGAGLAVGAWILPDLVGRGAALELTMTGRWLGAAEGLALGLVNRIDDDPDRPAAGLAATLAALGPQATGKIKTIASAGGLLDRLRAERQASRAAWAQITGPGSELR
jgi:enoyl-CoA hydratase